MQSCFRVGGDIYCPVLGVQACRDYFLKIFLSILVSGVLRDVIPSSPPCVARIGQSNMAGEHYSNSRVITNTS
ncbi:hypothetical protein RRG08_031985 [Elysia crispata]|uniref:Uncharacterized protein n=1 Tax=Elysia crispata TaxID=231223 RepID=A0AAE1DA67_9GAST|nr:hypothetical protein RRG08_031985 [Elysia crispata]